MKKYLLLNLILVSSLIFIGCSTFYQYQKSSYPVLRSGIISLYVNNDFYNVDGFKEDIGLELLDFFAKENDEEQNQDFTKNLLIFTRDKLLAANINIANNQIVSPEEYINLPAFKKPIKDNIFQLEEFNFDDSYQIEKNYFTFLENLKPIHFNGIVEKVETEDEDITATAFSYKEIGDFAERINLDGVWIIEVDAGYKKLDYVSESKIRPSISLRLAMIDKDGIMAINIFNPLKEKRERYLGRTVDAKFRDNGYLDLNNSPDVYSAYQETLDKALDELISFLKKQN